MQSKGSLKAEHQQFGPSLRAPPYTSAGKDAIFVPGYYDRRPMKSIEKPWRQEDHPNGTEDDGDNESQVGVTPNMETDFSGEDINAKNFQNSNLPVDKDISRNKEVEFCHNEPDDFNTPMISGVVNKGVSFLSEVIETDKEI